jgi:enamine deaminase RidA (YjgF/YER057c/UK114 family)
MSRITRTDPGPAGSRALDYHGFVFTGGILPADPEAPLDTQVADVLAQADALLEAHGTDSTRLLSAQLHLASLADRAVIEHRWTHWLPEGLAPACAWLRADPPVDGARLQLVLIACK